MIREEAIEKLKSQRNVTCNGCLHAVGWCESHCKFSEAIDMAIEALKQPEIVRCGECEHYKIDHPKANGYHCCYRCHNIFPMKETDFCSKAERRTECE